MNLNTWSLVVVGLIALQMTIAYVITGAYKEVFDNRPANSYAQAISELAKKTALGRCSYPHLLRALFS